MLEIDRLCLPGMVKVLGDVEMFRQYILGHFSGEKETKYWAIAFIVNVVQALTFFTLFQN
jgi:hypothetical protein